MITATPFANGQISFEQKPEGPTIYLDQWMWVQLSKDAKLRERFTRSAASRNSCIMYSLVSLMELSKISDQGQLDTLAELMDILDFGFVEMDFNKVIGLEKRHESTTLGVFNGRHPAGDIDLLNYMIRRHYPQVPKMSALLRDMKEEIPARYSAMAERLHADLTPMIERARADPVVSARAKTKNRARSVLRAGPPYTEDIWKCLSYYLVANKDMKMNPNEWMDVFHLVVPVAYLEFVTVDKTWLDFVRNRLSITSPDIARVYGSGEIELLLRDLDQAR